jgi:hypothetical protein
MALKREDPTVWFLMFVAAVLLFGLAYVAYAFYRASAG